MVSNPRTPLRGVPPGTLFSQRTIAVIHKAIKTKNAAVCQVQAIQVINSKSKKPFSLDFETESQLANNNTFSDRKRYQKPWHNIIKDLKKLGFFVIEPLDNIVKIHDDNPYNIINNDGVHYTPLANRMIAEHIQNNLKNPLKN